jgi:hypothetical protein
VIQTTLRTRARCRSASRLGDLQLAAERRAWLVVRDRLVGRPAVSRAVGHHEADGHVARDDLPRGAAPGERVGEPRTLRLAEDRGRPGPGGLPVGRVRAAVAAQVHHEELEQRAVGEAAVDAPRRDRVAADGQELEQRPRRPLGEHVHPALGVARVVLEHEPVVPVVDHLVVVPLRDHRHRSVEAARVRVEQVVGEVAAELVERLGDLVLRLGHQVAPHVPSSSGTSATSGPSAYTLSPECTNTSGSVRRIAS